MGKLQFLKQKKFYFHLLAIILLSFFLLWLTIRLLNVYTRHGKVYELPDFRGMTIEQVDDLYGRAYHLILVDSVYSKTEAPGTIVQQDPLPESKVKHGRNVYYIIVAKTPEKTTMPNLNNLSLRQALVLLESSGLEVKELIYTDHFARNAICEQHYDGKVVKPGTELIKGSKITLYVGLGTDRRNTKLPKLYDTPAEDVQHILNMAGLNLGKETFEHNDSIQYMKVYKMEPPYSKGSVRPGTFVDVWYRSSKKFDFDKERKNMQAEDSLTNAKERQAVLDSLAALNDSIAATQQDLEEDDDDEYEDDF
ncbi:MAG: PASTA domain-containing protein [Bacteroidales bacterium]|nr:PASTA domain-containing protein [Bacteroidales bacterium]